MGEAMVASLIRAKVSSPEEISVCDPCAARRRLLKRRYKVSATSNGAETAKSARVLVLAVKPQQMADALEDIADFITRRHLALSIAAGRTIAVIERLLPAARVVRVMPNLPCTVGKGVSVFCMGSRTNPADGRTVNRILSSMGGVLELPETKFDVVTAISGSGPAFFAYLLDCIADSGVRLGLTRKEALSLAEQTMLGTAELLIRERTDPRDLIESVSSAKGTTVAGLSVLTRPSTGRTIDATVRAAAKRSRELSGS